MTYDINLIPKNRKNASNRMSFLMLLIGLFCAVVLAVFFFIFPLQQKLSLMKQMQAQEEELSTYSNIEEEYHTLTRLVDKLNRTVLALDTLRTGKVNLTTLMDDIEKCTPKKVTANNIVLEDGLITIEGSSSTYKEMAQFMVNLRKIEGVLGVTFTNATAEEATNSSTSGSQSSNRYSNNQLYNFTIYINYNIKDIISELQLEETSTEVVEEVAQDEVD